VKAALVAWHQRVPSPTITVTMVTMSTSMLTFMTRRWTIASTTTTGMTTTTTVAQQTAMAQEPMRTLDSEWPQALTIAAFHGGPLGHLPTAELFGGPLGHLLTRQLYGGPLGHLPAARCGEMLALYVVSVVMLNCRGKRDPQDPMGRQATAVKRFPRDGRLQQPEKVLRLRSPRMFLLNGVPLLRFMVSRC
jgi:hypothetical protein